MCFHGKKRRKTLESLFLDFINLIFFVSLAFKATFNQIGGDKGVKKKPAKSGVVRKQSQQRQSKAKAAVKAKSKQKKSKDSSQPLVCDHEEQSKAASPSGEILGSQDSLEESSLSQDSLQISRLVQLYISRPRFCSLSSASRVPQT